MKYIEKITCDEFNEAFFNYFDVATKEDYWEVQGAYARPEDICYKTTDNNCYYCLEKRQNNNFVYFAYEKKRLINIKGLWESLIEMVKEGCPYIRFSGFHGRYEKILKGFGYFWETKDTANPTYQAYICYVAHPDIIEKLKRRVNK